MNNNKMQKKIKICHLDTELGFRGGENQIKFLLLGLQDKVEVKNYFVGQPTGKAISKFESICETKGIKMCGGLDVRAALKLKTWADENKIDLLDAHTANAHSIGLLAKIFGAKYKLVVHRRVDNIPKKNMINRLKYQSKLVSKYVCISNAIKEVMKNFGVADDKLEIVKSAVDSTPYLELSDIQKTKLRGELATKYRFQTNKVTFICAAAFTEQKGHMTLLKAWSEIAQDVRSDAILLLAGEGQLQKDAKEFVESKKLADSVHFLGWCDDVPALLQASDVFVMPSNWEGLGTIFLEASFARLPLCGSNVGGTPEVIRNGVNGYLSEVGDYSGLAQNISNLIRSEDRRKVMGSQAYQIAAGDFSLSSMVEGNLNLYKKILENKNEV